MNRFFDPHHFPLFEGCPRNMVDELLQSSSNRLSAYAPEEEIARQGTPCRSLYLLCEGRVTALMTHDDGKELTIENLPAPEVLAPAFIFGSENRFPVTIRACTACRVWVISKDSFFAMLQKDASLLRNFLRAISDRSLFLSRKLNEFALQDLASRLTGYLRQHGKIQNLQQTAQILGVARPSLSRTLALLCRQGLVEQTDQGYRLTQKD